MWVNELKKYRVTASEIGSTTDNYQGHKHFGYDNDSGIRYPRDVFKFYQVGNFNHTENFSPQQKPTDLLEYLIKTYTNEGETVLDATMGSGSTGVAAINTGRNFIGFELEQKFFDIAQKRLTDAQNDKLQRLF